MRRILTFIIGLNLLTPGFSAPLAPTGVSSETLATEILWQKVRTLPVGERPRVVIVLGGGGARGLAHIGLLRAFEQEGIPIDQIIGISVGALIGALYAGGVSVPELEDMAATVGWDELTEFTRWGILKLFLTDELLSTEKMEKYLKERLGDKQFSELNIPFVCVATDIENGERVVFNDGSVAIAARASATIPGLFEPVLYRNKRLIDGGITDTLPADLAPQDDLNLVIGAIPRTDLEEYNVDSVLSSLVRALEIQKSVLHTAKKGFANFLIEPDAEGISIIDLNKREEAIRAGVQETRERIPELKKMIIRRTLEWRASKRGEDIVQ